MLQAVRCGLPARSVGDRSIVAATGLILATLDRDDRRDRRVKNASVQHMTDRARVLDSDEQDFAAFPDGIAEEVLKVQVHARLV